MRGTVFIFIKKPQAGRVKTRLGREIGMGRAAALFRIMMNRTISEARKSGADVILAVDPPHAVFERGVFADLPRIAQGPGDLGARMGRVFRHACGPAVVIGADAPGMRARHIRAALNSLRRHDVVFGPATDGGYWLIGLAGRAPAPDLFYRVRWSTSHALSDTLATLPAGFSVAFLDQLQDVDDRRDLAFLNRPWAAAR